MDEIIQFMTLSIAYQVSPIIAKWLLYVSRNNKRIIMDFQPYYYVHIIQFIVNIYNHITYMLK